ncbi:MAG: glycosyltransferase family 39 protein [candidate division WOR-3 bacterium]
MMKTLKKLIYICLIVYAIFYVVEAIIIISYPYQISYPEGFILNQAHLISKGKSIYQTINEFPYIVANYPPLYCYLCAIFVKLFGISFFSGRLITFFSVLGIAFLIYKIILEYVERDNAIIGSLLFISSSYIFKNSPFMRVDMLGLFFCFMGTYLFISQKKLILPVIFFTAALYTKQTFFAAPLAVALSLLQSDRKRAAHFIIGICLVTGLFFLLINQLTNGEFFLHNFVYNLNIFLFKQAIKHYVWALQNHAILILLSIIYIFYSVAEKKYSVLLIYFTLSCIIAISVGKIGANMNYFFEMIALSCVLTGLSLGKLQKEMNEKVYNYFSTSAILVQLILFLHMPYLTEPSATKLRGEDVRRVCNIISNTEGNIISEDAGLLVLSNKSVLFQPFELTQLANQKIWSQGVFIHNIELKLFSLIVLSFDINCQVDEERLTPEMVQAIKENYYIKEKIGAYYLYYPNPDN